MASIDIISFFIIILVFTELPSILHSDINNVSPNTNTTTTTTNTSSDDAVWLLSFKASSIHADPSGLLRSWNPSNHPCVPGSGAWFGVSCDTLSSSGRLVVASLNLTGISASGTLSASLANLTHLRILSLAHNSFSGPIPPQLGYLNSLQVLELQGCDFSGPIPPSFTFLSSLRLLNLSRNSLSGPIPYAFIGSSPTLSVLDLSNNQLSGDILNIINFSSRGSCQSLTYLSLSNNFLADNIPPDIGACSNLTALLLDGNILQGKIPPEIGRLSRLQILDVSRNSLTDVIPTELANCHSLSVLVLTNLIDFPSYQGTTGLDFASFRGEFNAFDGGLPSEILFLPKLQMLWAPRSNLGVGGWPLPTNWTASCSLRVLNLSQNNVTGSVPQTMIATCSNLTYLDLSSNALYGNLPPNLQGIIPLMVYLNVSRNYLSGGVVIPLQRESDLVNAPKSSSQDLIRLLDLHIDDGDGLIQKPYYSFANPCSGSGLVSSLDDDDDDNTNDNSTAVAVVVVVHDFSWNTFAGPLPLFSPLVNMAAYWLLLNNNNFTASLSADLVSSFCSNLLHSFYLNLNANRIYGGIGSKFLDCSSLVHFEAAQNQINGSISAQVGDLKMLKYLDLSRNVLSGSLPDRLAELKGLQYILLSENDLTGQIPPQLGQLTALVALNLSHNTISGDIPSSLAALSNLSQLDLSFNNLSGHIPHFRRAINCDGFGGNRFLWSCPDQHDDGSVPPAGFPDPIEVHRRHNPSSKLKPFLIAISTTVSILFSIAVMLIGLYFGRRKLTRLASLRRRVVVAFADAPAGLNYDNVVRATGNFSVGNLIGTGGFGLTYKAELIPGFLVAVKRLSIGRFQGIQQFDAEIRTLGRIRHKNLVTLIGYYVGEAEMFLVYNYLPGGNLETFLHKRSGMNKEWRVIHKIAVDIAQALTYLHYSCVPRIVHRDIKPSNILLDDQLNAYLSDFGLARLLEVFETHATTDVAGTFGYVAPEYATTCRVSDKADVYSFGVVLFELMSGKKSLDPSFSEYGNGFNIVAWAGVLFSEGRSSELFTPELWESSPQDDLLAMLRLASSCTAESLSMRPSMKQVLEILKGFNL